MAEITLTEVLAALEKAAPDWRKHRFGVIRAGEFVKYPNGSAQSQIASFTSDAGDEQRDFNCDAALLAVNYLRANADRLHENERDAGRYRLLRNAAKVTDFTLPRWTVAREEGGYGQTYRGEQLDTAIDAAIASAGEGEG